MEEFITSEAPKSFATFNFSSSMSMTIGFIPYAALAIFKAQSPNPPALTITRELSLEKGPAFFKALNAVNPLQA